MKSMQFKYSLLHRLRMKETWVIFFITGIIMLDFPFMDIFNKNITILGLPLLFLYITTGWAISIFVIFLFTRSIRPDDDKEDGADRS